MFKFNCSLGNRYFWSLVESIYNMRCLVMFYNRSLFAIFTKDKTTHDGRASKKKRKS